MEYQKIIKLLDNTPNQLSKFRTNKKNQDLLKNKKQVEY